MPKTEQLIPTAQVATMLGKDVRTVHRLADSGALPAAMKLPGRTGALLFDREVVDRFLTEQPAPSSA